MTAPEPGETRGQRRERERAERAEWDHLTTRLGELWPNYDCFCGTLDDLRRTVADLERKAARERPPRSADAGAATHRRDAATAQVGFMTHRHVADDGERDEARREQLNRWHAADHAERATTHVADGE